MSLLVPPVDSKGQILAHRAVFSPTVSPSADQEAFNGHGGSYKVKYDSIRQEIVLEQDKPCSIRRGDWIVLTAMTSKYNF